MTQKTPRALVEQWSETVNAVAKSGEMCQSPASVLAPHTTTYDVPTVVILSIAISLDIQTKTVALPWFSLPMVACARFRWRTIMSNDNAWHGVVLGLLFGGVCWAVMLAMLVMVA